MGQFVSVITSSIENVARDIATLVTDAATTGAQLAELAKQFTPVVMHEYLAVGGADTLTENIIDAMTAVEDATKAVLKKVYKVSGDDSTDSGCVENYKAKGNLQTVIGQMHQNFENWGIPAEQRLLDSMSKTIQGEVDAKHGLAGTSYGFYNLNANERINWAVGYGLFTIAAGNDGLVYAFSAKMGSRRPLNS